MVKFGMQVAMAEPLADGGEAHASVDELRRVGVAQLVQGGVDAGGSRLPDPVLVDRLIAQRTTPTILFQLPQVARIRWDRFPPHPPHRERYGDPASSPRQ